MTKSVLLSSIVAGLLVLAPPQSAALTNPDQISIFFPAMQGTDNLGHNVSTVLSLQLAQTTRRMPWPNNPRQHDFGRGIIRYTMKPLEELSHEAANTIAQNRNLRAQMVIWGRTFQYGGDVIAEVNVTIPRYRVAPSRNCKPADQIKCDYRQKNFERWQISRDGHLFSVDVPRRKFGLSSIVLRQDVVDRFKKAKGLVIRKSIENGREIGVTDADIRFLEFNKKLPGAPTKVRSNGVEGYVSLPELSEQVSEYADFVGGVLQIFRGDWELAVSSFKKVLENPKTRTMIQVDSLLYSGMAKMRLGIDGRKDFEKAAELAPFDHMVTRYQINGAIASGENKSNVNQMLNSKSFLFAEGDPWFLQVQDWSDNR